MKLLMSLGVVVLLFFLQVDLGNCKYFSWPMFVPAITNVENSTIIPPQEPVPPLPRLSLIPDTGQTHSYTNRFGEDSDYIINPHSYTVNSNGTVTDNVTSLMWQREGAEALYNWYEASGTAHPTENIDGAADVCGNLSLAGYNDWRLPSVNELLFIADSSKAYPSIDTTVFPDPEGVYRVYWSSTELAQENTYSSSGGAWYVAYDYGGADHASKYSSYFVRCVRGEESVSTFVDNGNGTVTDNVTGLMWQQRFSPSRYWFEAIGYCEDLALAGYDDWRLPNKNELASIIDYNNYDPAIDEAIFGRDSRGYLLWSSTTYGESVYNFWENYAWRVWFSYGGNVDKRRKDSGLGAGVRCVRGSQ